MHRNVVEPKFKVGEEVWTIHKSYIYHSFIRSVRIDTSKVDFYGKGEIMEETKIEYHLPNLVVTFSEHSLFKTKQEVIDSIKVWDLQDDGYHLLEGVNNASNSL